MADDLKKIDTSRPQPNETDPSRNVVGIDGARDAGAEERPDPFDPQTLRLRTDTLDSVGVERPLIHVPVRRPSQQAFFRVHPSQDYRLAVHLLDLKDEGEIYLVRPDVAPALAGDVRPVELRVYITRQRVVGLWPVPLPTEDGRTNSWHNSAREIAQHAERKWCRMKANRALGSYDLYTSDHIPDPDWPDHDFKRLLEVAFGNGHLIDREDHPVIRQLLGYS